MKPTTQTAASPTPAKSPTLTAAISESAPHTACARECRAPAHRSRTNAKHSAPPAAHADPAPRDHLEPATEQTPQQPKTERAGRRQSPPAAAPYNDSAFESEDCLWISLHSRLSQNEACVPDRATANRAGRSVHCHPVRILIYGINYPRADRHRQIHRRDGLLVAWRGGHEPILVTAPPYYPAWSIRKITAASSTVPRSISASSIVYRTPLYVPRNPPAQTPGAPLLLHARQPSGHAASVSLEPRRRLHRRTHLLERRSPSSSRRPPARFSASRAGLRRSDAPLTSASFPRRVRPRSLALGLEQAFTRAFTQSPASRTRWSSEPRPRASPLTASTLFPNWADIDAVHPQDPRPPTPSAANSTRKARPSSSTPATWSQARPLNLALSPPPSSTTPAHFLFCGDGAFAPLESLIAGRSNVTLLPLQPLERLNDLLNAAQTFTCSHSERQAQLTSSCPPSSPACLERPPRHRHPPTPAPRSPRVVAGERPDKACGLVVAAEDPTAP